MKSILNILIMVLALGTGLNAQKAGIQFVSNTLTFKEILEKAQKENKPIFIDAFAEWCGPCKKMDREVFVASSVGEVYNAKFINVKIDMEKGEGPELAKKYGIQAYPSYLFLDTDGGMLHRSVGYQQPDAFIELANVATDPAKQLGSMARQYFNGNRQPDFLYNYTVALMDVMDPKAKEIGGEYLKTQDDWNNDNSRQFMMNFIDRAEGEYYEYMIANRAAFIDQFGKESYKNIVLRAVSNKLGSEDAMDPEVAGKMFGTAYPEEAAALKAQFKMMYYQRLKQYDAYARAAIELNTISPIQNPYQLNGIAWTFYEQVNDKELLKEGLKMAEKSVSISKEYANMDTLAALYLKMGKKKLGKKTAKEAIEIAKASGEDYSGTEELLKKKKHGVPAQS
jgi:thiol-disulfide isomerase/thioredoxin